MANGQSMDIWKSIGIWQWIELDTEHGHLSIGHWVVWAAWQKRWQDGKQGRHNGSLLGGGGLFVKGGVR